MLTTSTRSTWPEQWSNYVTIRLATSIICLGFAAGILLSFKLWTNARLFPLAPVWSSLPGIPFPGDYALAIVLLLLLLAACTLKHPRIPILCSVIVTVVLMCLDQSRLQPWAYQYVCMLLILGTYSWRNENEQEQSTILHACRIMIAFVYIWSGIQKMNPFFMQDLYPWMISSVTGDIPPWASESLQSFGILIPFIESGIGIGLLVRTTRKISLVFAAMMCCFIFWTIGPTGHNWNAVVWPWDIALLLLAFVLFMRTGNVSLRNMISAPYSTVQKIILCAFCVLPALSFFNVWDAYLSFAVYSGNTKTATIEMRNPVIDALPSDVRRYINPGSNILTLTPWTMGELHITPYPEKRIFKALGAYICSFADKSDDVQLTIHSPNSWTHTFAKETLDCSQMGMAL